MTVVRQRTIRDCGVSALAVLLVDAIVRRIDPEMQGLNGLYNRELIAAASQLGLTLRSKRNFDLDADDGLLRVRWKSGDRRQAAPHGHWVTLIHAVIHDPADATVLPWRNYCALNDAQPMTLLKVTRR